MSLNTELLSCRRLTTGLMFPARQFQPGELNRLYAQVTEQYPYQTLQHLPDGVRMANPENDCIIQGGQIPNPGRIQINENDFFHFEAAKQKVLQVFRIVCDELSVQQFLAFGVKLTAFLPTQDRSSAEIIENSALGGFKPLLDELGTGRQGTGLRVVLHNDGVFDLRIEPFFGDLSNLYIELDLQQPEPFNNLDSLDARMSRAYKFLNEDIRTMLGHMEG